ncbi:hypothetical protein KCTC52924_00843 [Arenibacter antarcticus]|uniref:Uncharacterized protein n=1 Tax=Arenibacter antarcticus TaxID=2040469 RepID=A0ABW5VB80_9FLAO|nr:hypothetical protein [Arenibacter sp. H213]MCM4167646.1 hypothetical protein [Arenibacter sp. H213]
MGPYTRYILGVIMLLVTLATAIAQDVRIVVPASNIVNKTEFSIDRVVMHTGNNNKWENWSPTVKSLESVFKHKTVTSAMLPTSVLQWQLQTIGGASPLDHNDDRIPGFQSFSTSDKTWFEPKNKGSKYTGGNIVFKFIIPATAFANNTFQPGEYSLTITHNYANYFSPNSFEVIIVIPQTSSPINWMSNTPTKYHEISSLAVYRNGLVKTFDAIGPAEISNTVNFNLWAKSNASTIQFTSSKGVSTPLAISLIKLSSSQPKIATAALSDSWNNRTLNNPFGVVTGNKHNFDLQFSISDTDFKTHFFEAGNYIFQLNLDAKSTDNHFSDLHNTDVTFKVSPLSEISIDLSKLTVTFDFNTSVHYQQGQSKVISNQLKLSNNENYELYVKSDAPFFNKSGVQSDIPSSILQVGVVGGLPVVALSTNSQEIINTSPAVLDRNLDIKYSISPNAAQSLIGKEKGTYSINVIYSFTAL